MTGRVLAKTDGRPLPGAVVTAGITKATADADGRFTLTARPGPLRVVVSSPSFIDQPIDLTITPGMGPVELSLAKTSVQESIDISDTAVSAPQSVVALQPSSVLRVAGAGDNIFKALQTLPGVSATDDFGSRLAVRGGGPDQNLTVMDGVEIHNPYRLFGLTSAFNPETVRRFELTAGGFGAEYGDRLSSILVVENRSGTSSERLTGSAAMSLTDANVVLEGKLPGQARGSWLFTGRRTYYDLVADKITGNDLPSFGDLQARGDWHAKPGHVFSLFALRSREKTDATFTDSGDSIAVGDTSKNDLVSLSYSGVLSRQVTARSILAWYDYGDDLAVDGSVRDGARRSNSPERDAEQVSAIVFNRGLTVRDLSFRQQIDAQVGRRQTVSAGFDLHALRTTWDWTISGDRNGSVANGSAVIGGTGLPSLLASSRDTTRASAWLVDRLTLGPRVRMEPGLRIDRSGFNGEVVFSPRLSATVELGRGNRVKGSAGLFTQSPGYEKLLQSDYFVDLSADTAKQLSSERSTHVIGTFEHDVSPAITARVEAYYKTFDRLIIGRLETPEETAARVAEYDFPAALATSIPTSPQITSGPSNDGSGNAYGFDVYLEKRQRAAADRLSGWASYTWGQATLDAYGIRRPFDYDRRHSLSLVSTLRLSQRLDVGSTLRVASGFPATVPVGVRVASMEAPDGSGRLIPQVDARGLLVWTVDFGGVSNLSRTRLPMYTRLDLRITFKPKNPAGRWQIYVEILNALNRKNYVNLQPQLDFDPASDRPQIGYKTDSGLPRLPSFGLRYRF
ncbi:MAG: TonB-dependent receptor plug domain-containing protein [Acidobacteriota bacterium]